MANFNNKKSKIASQSEILRSHQRDNDFISQISESLTDILHRYNLYKNVSCFMKSDTPAKMLYFIITSGFGNQTLGEEYTGIVQADLDRLKVPSLMARILSAILECFGEQMLVKLLNKVQNEVNKPKNGVTTQAKRFLNIFLSLLRKAVPILIMIHRGLFYIYGRYYSIGRRLAGIDYVKIYRSRSQSSISLGLRILGIITITECLFKLCFTKNSIEEVIKDDKEFENISTNQCQLCLEIVSDTATPCGHLFCWTCLSGWLQDKNKCPVCRESICPSRIIPLMNF